MDSESGTSSFDWTDSDGTSKSYKAGKLLLFAFVIVCFLFTSGTYHYHFMLDIEDFQNMLPNVSIETAVFTVGQHKNASMTFTDWIELHQTEAALQKWQEAWWNFRSHLMVRYQQLDDTGVLDRSFVDPLKPKTNDNSLALGVPAPSRDGGRRGL